MDTWRPCQYDHHTLFDGYANIYTFLKDLIKINLAPLLLNEFNEGKEEFKSLDILVTKEPLKDTSKLCMCHPIPKPPWKVISMDFSLGLLWSPQQKDSINDSYQKINGVFLERRRNSRLEDKSLPTQGE
jgi:hypothetical protein